MATTSRVGRGALTAALVVLSGAQVTASAAAKEPAFNPFGERKVGIRRDAIPGAIYYSDGTILTGDLYLTRDKKLRIFIEKEGQHHWIPFGAVKSITTVIAKEWKEKHWRWLENANDVKVYTGRFYPVRMYEYDILLKSANDREKGKTLRVKRLYNPIYIRYSDTKNPIRFILHHGDKGKLDQTFKDMFYIKQIDLGEDARQQALKRIAMLKKIADEKKAKQAAAEAADPDTKPDGPTDDVKRPEDKTAKDSESAEADK